MVLTLQELAVQGKISETCLQETDIDNKVGTDKELLMVLRNSNFYLRMLEAKRPLKRLV